MSIHDYPDLVKSFARFLFLRTKFDKEKKCDFSDVVFLKPTTLLPLTHIIKKYDEIIYPKKESVSNYLKTVLSYHMSKSETTYLPIIGLPQNQNQMSEITKNFYNNLSVKFNIGGLEGVQYIIGELIDNIYQHSSFKNANVMSQVYNTKKNLEFSIYDDGVSIPTSIEERFPNIGKEKADEDILVEAIDGLSRFDDKDRGFGLKTIYNLIVNGLKSDILIASKFGVVFASHDKQNKYSLVENGLIQGTLISVRINEQSKQIDLFKYVG